MAKTRKKLSREENEDFSVWDSERTNLLSAKIMSSRIEIKCRSNAQKEVLRAIDEKVISVIIGPPGTGKTYLSCAKALKFIKEESMTYRKIVLIKSVNVPKDEEIGYLKGTLEEKMEMYMYPLNLH